MSREEELLNQFDLDEEMTKETININQDLG
jgi:hypothetical protein